MPEPQPPLPELLRQVEEAQKRIKTWLDTADSQQPALGVSPLLSASNGLLALSRVFLDLAVQASNAGRKRMRQPHQPGDPNP